MARRCALEPSDSPARAAALDGVAPTVARTRLLPRFALEARLLAFVVEREGQLTARKAHELREGRVCAVHLGVVRLQVEVRDLPLDFGDGRSGGGVAEVEELLAVLALLLGTSEERGHEREPLRGTGLWPQAKPVGLSERLKKNDLSGRQIVFLQSRTFARCVIQNESICRWGKEGNA